MTEVMRPGKSHRTLGQAKHIKLFREQESQTLR